MYKYIHDRENRIVYKHPEKPNVQEEKDRKGNRTGWWISMTVDITKAENKLHNNQWDYPTSAYPRQHLHVQYPKEIAISYFMINHAPPGEEISQSEYEKLHKKYDAEARAR